MRFFRCLRLRIARSSFVDDPDEPPLLADTEFLAEPVDTVDANLLFPLGNGDGDGDGDADEEDGFVDEDDGSRLLALHSTYRPASPGSRTSSSGRRPQSSAQLARNFPLLEKLMSRTGAVCPFNAPTIQECVNSCCASRLFLFLARLLLAVPPPPVVPAATDPLADCLGSSNLTFSDSPAFFGVSEARLDRDNRLTM